MSTVLASSPKRSGRRVLSMVLPPFIAFGVVIGLWYLSSWLQFDTGRRRAISQPYPHDIVKVGFLTWRNLNEMLNSLYQTAWVSIVGLVFAMLLGVALAIIMSMSQVVERTLYPYAIVLQTIPIVAITPLMIIWFGTNRMPRVLVCVLIAIFPIITNTLFGLKSSDRGQIDLFRLHGAGRLRRLWKLDLPSSLPAMFTGFRISAGLSVIGAIVGEFVGAQAGLGYLILQKNFNMDMAGVFAILIVLSAMGIGLHLLVNAIQRRVVFWMDGSSDRVMGA